MKAKKSAKKTDTLRKDTPQKRTSTPTSISLGSEELELLKHLQKNKDERFNLKRFSVITKTARSTIYNRLNSLEMKGFVLREKSHNKISKEGEIYLETTNRGVQSSRQECPDSQLSTHWHKFKLQIKDKSKFRVQYLNKINHKSFKENNLKNLHQVIIDFEDAKVIVNPKSVSINLFDIITKNVEESDMQSLSRVMEYVEELKKIGIVTEGMQITEEGHWARVNSVLSELIEEKLEGRYFLTLDDGSKFWIDHSDAHVEDETNSKVVRENLDNAINLLGTGKVNLEDLDKVKEITKNLSLIQISKERENIEQLKLEGVKLKLQKIESQLKLIQPPIVGYIG